MTRDYIVKALVSDGGIRAYAVLTAKTVQKAQTRHYTWPTASTAMGRTMTVTAMMGAVLKGDQELTVAADGRGSIGQVIADANAKGGMRIYVDHPQTHFPLDEQGKFDVRRAARTNGSIMVVKDIGMKDYSSGASPIVSGEFGKGLTYYYATSEQTPSSVGPDVLVNPDNTIKAAGGPIIQAMPGTRDETISKLEKAISKMTPVSKLTEQGLTPEGLLNEILGEDHVQISEKMPVQPECNHSHEKSLNAIKGLGEAGIQSTIEEDYGAEAVYHFCRNKYKYTEGESSVLLESLA